MRRVAAAPPTTYGDGVAELLPTLTLHLNDDLILRAQTSSGDGLIGLLVHVDNLDPERGSGERDDEPRATWLHVFGKMGDAWDLFPEAGDNELRGHLKHLAIGDKIRLTLARQPALESPTVNWPTGIDVPPEFPSDLFSGYRLRVNGELWTTAGFRGYGLGGVEFVWRLSPGEPPQHPGAPPGEFCRLNVGGLQDDVFSTWLVSRMHPADEIEIELVQVRDVQPPVVRYGLRDNPPLDAPGLDPRRSE